MAKTAHTVIRGDKAIKKKIAEFLAQYDVNYSHINVQELLQYGHRGYLAMSEKDLYSLMDQRYLTLMSSEFFKELPKMNVSSWNREESIEKERLRMIASAKSVFDEIFEKSCLV